MCGAWGEGLLTWVTSMSEGDSPKSQRVEGNIVVVAHLMFGGLEMRACRMEGGGCGGLGLEGTGRGCRDTGVVIEGKGLG